MSDFREALDHVLRWEGGASDDPDDSGGRTNYGISEAAHPDAWSDGPPTRSEAEDIYRRDYWRPLQCEEIESRNIAAYLFDAAVNIGPHRAVKLLQQGCNLLHQDIRVDGIMGPKTLRAINCVEAKRLLYVYMALRGEYYVGLAEAQSSQRKFLFGWLRRCYAPLTHE